MSEGTWIKEDSRIHEFYVINKSTFIFLFLWVLLGLTNTAKYKCINKNNHNAHNVYGHL